MHKRTKKQAKRIKNSVKGAFQKKIRDSVSCIDSVSKNTMKLKKEKIFFSIDVTIEYGTRGRKKLKTSSLFLFIFSPFGVDFDYSEIYCSSDLENATEKFEKQVLGK